MDRIKPFDRAWLGKQIGGIGMIVVLDVFFLIFSPFYGQMPVPTVAGIILLVNMLNTCILYQTLLLSRGETGFELITEKIVYFPTTRQRFLWNKYVKTLPYLLIQVLLAMLCLGIGGLAARGAMNDRLFLYGGLTVLIGIMSTSGMAILFIHLAPAGIYLSMLFYYPLYLLVKWLEPVEAGRWFTNTWNITLVLSIAGMFMLLWLLLLCIGVRLYERIN